MFEDFINIEKNGKYLDKGYKQDTTRFSKISKHSIKCKNCGHTILPTKERFVCSHCGFYVYRDGKAEFKYKLKKILKKH